MSYVTKRNIVFSISASAILNFHVRKAFRGYWVLTFDKSINFATATGLADSFLMRNCQEEETYILYASIIQPLLSFEKCKKILCDVSTCHACTFLRIKSGTPKVKWASFVVLIPKTFEMQNNFSKATYYESSWNLEVVFAFKGFCHTFRDKNST